jgi:predicted transcriptional regulator
MIDFKKYKRFFAFGCSMTSYGWPTWADIIAQEIPESYNYGQSGGGNLFIACQVTEASLRYRFTDTDLVMIMWSGVSREDRYVDKDWLTPGNIYSQNYYDTTFVKKYADPTGYLIRDLNLITLTVAMLENQGVSHCLLNMAPFDQLQSTNKQMSNDIDQILNLYKPTIDKLLPDLLTLGLNGRWPQHPIRKDGGQTADYHPSPSQHFTYLKKLFPNYVWSDTTTKFVQQAQYSMEQIQNFDDLVFKKKSIRL